MRDLIGEAGINWELPWGDVPAVKKAKLYQTVSMCVVRGSNDKPYIPGPYGGTFLEEVFQ